MDRFGHQLMAVNVDNQLLTLLGGYLHGIMEKFSSTSGISTSYISSFKTELNAVTEAAYYLASFSLGGNTRASPGMRSVGLEVPQESVTTLAVLVCSYIAVKWSALKLSALSVSQGWQSQPEATMERRTHDILKAASLLGRCLCLLSYAVFLCRGDSASPLYRLTGIQMAAATAGGGSSSSSGEGGGGAQTGTVAAGYSSAQLYVEGKKALWLSLVGASAAASVTIDWRALRHCAYFYACKAAAALHRLRVGRAREQQDPSVRAESAETGAAGHERRSGAVDTADAVSAPLHTCVACQLSPPEMPHAFECGHVYCYLCAHTLLHATSSASLYSWTEGGTEGPGEGASCLQCYKRVSSMAPYAPHR